MALQSRSAALRREIESSLASRIPAALSPQAVQAPRLLPLANEAVNALLGGGLPIGGISEFTGPASAGRTSLAFSVLSEATVDSACAYIDATDSLDARSAAAAGVRLTNLLWVRCSPEQDARPDASVIDPAKMAAFRQDCAVDRSTRSTQHHGIGHPRTETGGIDKALEAMLVQKAEARLRKMEGTPGFPNRKLTLAAAPEEQVAYDRFHARRADASDPLRRMDRQAAEEARLRSPSPAPARSGARSEEKPWSRLDKALRAADRILQAGGFRVVVLDLASIPPEQALRIPSATWYRFSRAAQEGDAILLLLTQEPCARSSAKCVLECAPHMVRNESSHVLGSMAHTAEAVRQRVADPCAKKSPGRAVAWSSIAPCMRSVGMPRAAER